MDNGSAFGLKIIEFGWEILTAMVLVAYHFISIRRKATQDDLNDLKKMIVTETKEREAADLRNKERIADLENKILLLATKDDLHEIELKIATGNEQIKSLTDAIKSLGRTTSEIQQYLLDKKL